MGTLLDDSTTRPPVMTEAEREAYEAGRRMRRDGKDYFDLTEIEPYRRGVPSTKWAREQGYLDEEAQVPVELTIAALRNGENV